MIIVPLSSDRVLLGCDSADRNAAGENKSVWCPVLGNCCSKLHPQSPIALASEGGSHTDASAGDSCGGWAIFVLGLSVQAMTPHIKLDLASHPISVGSPA